MLFQQLNCSSAFYQFSEGQGPIPPGRNCYCMQCLLRVTLLRGSWDTTGTTSRPHPASCSPLAVCDRSISPVFIPTASPPPRLPLLALGKGSPSGSAKAREAPQLLEPPCSCSDLPPPYAGKLLKRLETPGRQLGEDGFSPAFP